jgi:hypothetical protein
MRRFLQLFTLVLTCMSFSVIAPPCVYACSCAVSLSPHAARDEATAVFSGKVVGMHAHTGAILSSADPTQITFEVSQVWKGPASTHLVVATARESASCGVPFEVNTEYLVYASGPETMLQASLCSRTLPLSESQAQEDLDVLGQGMVPSSTPPPSLLPSPIPASTAALAATASAALSGLPTLQPRNQVQAPLPLLVCVSLCLLLGVILIHRRRRQHH